MVVRTLTAMADDLGGLEVKLDKLDVQAKSESRDPVLEEVTLEGVVKLIRKIKASDDSQFL